MSGRAGGSRQRREPQAAELCSVRDAATRLGVSPSTVWRWVNAGWLPAVRLGPRSIRIRRRDVDHAVRPASVPTDAAGLSIITDLSAIRPTLTEEERARGYAAMAAADAFRAQLLKKRRGKPFSDSAELIREAREERMQQL
jgi:excisionase family DNA binding protein